MGRLPQGLHAAAIRRIARDRGQYFLGLPVRDADRQHNRRVGPLP